jgi:hypothetical protein
MDLRCWMAPCPLQPLPLFRATWCLAETPDASVWRGEVFGGESASRATTARGVLGHKGCGAAVLTTGGEALDHSQDHHQHGRPQPDRRIGRDGDRQYLSVSDAIAAHTSPPIGLTRNDTAKVMNASRVVLAASPGKIDSAI